LYNRYLNSLYCTTGTWNSFYCTTGTWTVFIRQQVLEQSLLYNRYLDSLYCTTGTWTVWLSFLQWKIDLYFSLFSQFWRSSERIPAKTTCINSKHWPFVLCTFQMFLHKFWCDTNDMLTFPVFDHVQWLKGADDIILCNAGHLAVSRNLINDQK
jgi:hypothetical protein